MVRTALLCRSERSQDLPCGILYRCFRSDLQDGLLTRCNPAMKNGQYAPKYLPYLLSCRAAHHATKA